MQVLISIWGRMFFTSWLFTSFKKVFKKVCYIKFLRPPSNSREAKNPVFCPFNFAMRVWVNLRGSPHLFSSVNGEV